MAGHGAIEGAARARRGPVRERIFEAACALFYEHGIHQVGVDAIATAAGTNKMSFYRSFASKDALVALYLRQRERALWQWWDQAIAAHARAPRRQIEALFAELVRHCRGQASWGCAVANAAAEIRDPSHPAIAVIHTQKAELQRRFRALARAAGAREPAVLGDALTLLFDGVLTAKLTFAGRQAPHRHLSRIVARLLDAEIG